jgi:hypothetical protein
VARYEALWGKPPRLKNREALFKRCAWKMQEIRMGGLSVAAKGKLESLITEIHLPEAEDRRTVRGTLRKPPVQRVLAVGTTITRTWHDQQLLVRVVDGGFEYQGVVYRSLSAVALAITGAHWNGKLFFGLTGRSRS